MGSRVEIINSFYDKDGENDRLLRSRHGQLEYLTTMYYIIFTGLFRICPEFWRLAREQGDTR